MTDQTPDRRDQRWLEEVFGRHHQAVLAYARRRVPLDDADDIVGEVFAAAWKYRERVPDLALPWLYRAASHHVLHVHRSAGRRGRLVERFAWFQHSDLLDDHADGVARAVDSGVRVRAALLQLTPRDAEILCLDAWERLDNNGLAYVLGCTPTTARVRLHRARRRLSHVLDTSSDTLNVTSEDMR